MSTQTIFRVAHRNMPFSQIGNAMLRDKRLSFEARGALAMLLTYPADWQFNVVWLCDQGGIGRDQARRVVKELEDHGYCTRKRARKDDGTLGPYVFTFTDQPGESLTPAPENQAVVETSDWKPVTGEPAPENPPTTNKVSNKQGHKEHPPTPSKPRGRTGKSELPDDWQLPEEWASWARQHSPTRSHFVQHEAQKFREYWIGKGGRMKDWRLTWQRWWRTSCERPAPKGTLGKPAETLPPDKLLAAVVWGKADRGDPVTYRADTPEFNSYITDLVRQGDHAEAERIQFRGWVKLYPKQVRQADTAAANVVAHVRAIREGKAKPVEAA